MKTRSGFAIVSLLGIASLVQAPAVFAQEPTSASTDNNGGWRRLGDQTAQDAANQAEVRDDAKEIEDLSDLAPSGPELAQRRGPAGPPPPNARGPQGQRNQPPVPAPRPLPAQLNVAAGTFFTIRVNQAISTDHSQVGDAFTAQLVKPIVVDGRIIADRGQTIAGRVAEVQKGGRIRGTSRLGVELTEMTLVDGQQIPVRSQLIGYTGPGSVGRDATAVGTTTGIGALVGAAAAGGQAAAIGAGAGAAASLIGVLLTRGHPTVIYPESVLTFRIEQPIAIDTTQAPAAFRPVGPGDYNQPSDQPRLQTRAPAPGYGPNPYFGPYYGGGWWGPGWGYGWPYYGPSVGFIYRGRVGGGFRGGGFRGGGFRGGGFRGRR